MGGNHAVWYHQVAHFASRYRVVTWDQRGFGRSTAISGDLGPVPAVRDLARLLDHLGVDVAHIVGQSMGGWCSLGFAIDHPERTISLTLADTTAGLFTPEIRRVLDAYGQQIAAAPPPDQWPLGFHPAVGTQLLEEDLARAFLYTQLSSLADPPAPEVVMASLMGTDHTGRVTGMTAPTLFIVGEHDPIFPPPLIQSTARLIPDSEVAVVENTGHSPYFERPSRWNDILAEFLRKSTT
jgi:2-succinyl-6-hydroxy-2,4-cyclohexadiene-1-carboxylate synthase